MGILHHVLNAGQKAQEALEKVSEATTQIQASVPEALINKLLAGIDKRSMAGIDEISELNVVLHDGYMEVAAQIRHSGIAACVRMSLEVVALSTDLSINGRGTFVIRQRGPVELQGHRWKDKLAILVARAVLAAMSGTTLERWALGGTDGIEIKDDTYTFDLDALGIRTRLAHGLLDLVGTENRLLRLGAETLASMYSVTGADCKDKTLTIQLARTERTA